MGLIDADKVLNVVVAYCPDDDGSCSKAGIDLREMLDEIEALPEIDAEPIVRCENCKFVDTLECPMNYIDHQRQIFSNRSPDWFCAEGVRKDET